ncbi:MAG: hypothetical protein RMJ47_05660 [Bacteroidota bacterium]|nr:hypothetical protein [Bacteroidota bacterium]
MGAAIWLMGTPSAEGSVAVHSTKTDVQLLRIPSGIPLYPLKEPRAIPLNGQRMELVAERRATLLRRLPARSLQNLPGVRIANTTYDWQTNFLIKNRMVWYGPENVLQLVWMASSDQPDSGFRDRGTYYAAVDLSNPENPSVIPTQRGWTRIEAVRTGWPAAAALPGGAVAFMSHTPLRFVRNQGPLDESWSVTDVGPAGSLWPYLTSTAEGTLHVVYTYNAGNNAGQVAYRRSTDQGRTWSDEVFLSGGEAPPAIQGADHYIIEAGGGRLLVAYLSVPLETGPTIILRLSADNGATWSPPVPLAAGQFQFARYEESTIDTTAGDTTIRVTVFHTDTIPGVDNYSFLVDDRGRWHALATLAAYFLKGRHVVRRLGAQVIEDTVYYDSLRVAGAYPMGVYGFEGATQGVLVPLPPPVVGRGGQVVQVRHTIASGYVDRLKLGIDDQGRLYAVMSAPNEGDTIAPEDEPTAVYGYGHIYLTTKLNDTTWSPPVNLTPNGVDCSFPTAPRGGPVGYAVIAYQAGGVPGSFVQGARWQSGQADDIYVMTYALPTGVNEEAHSGGVQFRVYPNPIVKAGHIQLIPSSSGWLSLELCSPVGSRVKTLYEGWAEANKPYSFLLDAAELPSGVYYLRLHHSSGSVVRQLVVVR